MPTETGFYVTGLRELTKAFAQVGPDAKKEFRTAERQIAEPVRKDAETLAGSTIRNMPASPAWSRMRTGVTQNVIYVAPRKKGVRGKGRRRRPNLADLMMSRAMQPALERNTAAVEEEFERLLDRVATKFNEGGTL